MLWRPLLIYAVVELAAVIALVSAIGWGWTLLTLLGTFLLGWCVLAPMAGARLIHRIGQLRSGLNEPRTALSDGAFVALAMVLVLVPGLVTTAVGLLLLVPPIRSVAGPGLTDFAVRGLRRRVPLIGYARVPEFRRADRDYIDGEVIDVHDVEQPALPERRD
jgi:UPF0716 protein FxsA